MENELEKAFTIEQFYEILQECEAIRNKLTLGEFQQLKTDILYKSDTKAPRWI